MPVHPPFFPQDEFTDRTERFFASEIIREKIFLNYDQEIPYSTEVAISDFKEDETNIVRIRADNLCRARFTERNCHWQSEEAC